MCATSLSCSLSTMMLPLYQSDSFYSLALISNRWRALSQDSIEKKRVPPTL